MATQVILDGGLYTIGTFNGSTSSIPGLTTSSAHTATGSTVIYDRGLNPVGYTTNGAVYFIGLTSSTLVSPYSDIVDSGLNIIGQWNGTYSHVYGI